MELEYLARKGTAKRDRVVVEYSVYSSIGRLAARNLGLSVPYYEPLEYYNSCRLRWPPTSDWLTG